jgi:hypothetical protein
MRWFKRTHLTTLKTIDNMETKVSYGVYWFFEVAMIYFYNKVILNIINVLVNIMNFIVYLPLFIIFLFPSLAVELFLYSKKTRVTPIKRTNEEHFDLINKGK